MENPEKKIEKKIRLKTFSEYFIKIRNKKCYLLKYNVILSAYLPSALYHRRTHYVRKLI